MMPKKPAELDPQSEARPPRSAYRWVICALLFLATTINYLDRQILVILAKRLQDEIKWNELKYSYNVMAFQAAYGIGLLCFGWLIDRWGTKRGYSIAIFIWSIAAAAHALARSALGFGIARFALGIGEAGNFPAAIKSVAEWFPKRERALATGLFNAGSNIGAIIAPAVVPWMALAWGWREAFVILGIAGLVWIALWQLFYDEPARSPRVSAAELAHIRSGDGETIEGGFPWLDLLRYRQTWAYVVPSTFISPVWWFYLYWLPKYFGSRYALDLSQLGAPLIIVYTMAMIGSIGGGWFSSRLLAVGWSANAARKIAILISVLCVVPVAFITRADHVWLATLLAGLAAMGHQGMSANMYTMVSDLFPKRAVASIVGLGTAFGSAAAIGFSLLVGMVLNATGSYAIPFIIAGVGYPAMLVLLHLIEPRWEPIRDEAIGSPA
jgi:ACS family hexuronate transporter-like MFS transporter